MSPDVFEGLLFLAFCALVALVAVLDRLGLLPAAVVTLITGEESEDDSPGA